MATFLAPAHGTAWKSRSECTAGRCTCCQVEAREDPEVDEVFSTVPTSTDGEMHVGRGLVAVRERVETWRPATTWLSVLQAGSGPSPRAVWCGDDSNCQVPNAAMCIEGAPTRAPTRTCSAEVLGGRDDILNARGPVEVGRQLRAGRQVPVKLAVAQARRREGWETRNAAAHGLPQWPTR